MRQSVRMQGHGGAWSLAIAWLGTGLIATTSALTPSALGSAQSIGGVFTRGVWTLRLDGSAFTISESATELSQGRYRLEGQTLSFVSDEPFSIVMFGERRSCDASSSASYRLRLEDGLLRWDVVEDGCPLRRQVFDGSIWAASASRETVANDVGPASPRSTPAEGLPDDAWPQFRGPYSSGVSPKGAPPVQWDGEAGRGVAFKVPVAGLAHSSPVVWKDRIYVTSAVSTLPDASFRPGLYGDGDASEDRTSHEWTVSAFDRFTGERIWHHVATKGPPRDKRHIKSTYASASPTTDGKRVVAFFGSQGLFALDMEGRPLWNRELGRLDLGAYDIPSYEWGPASSPILWRGMVIVQCDTQHESFVMAIDASNGETVWSSLRDELPSWGTPNVYEDGETTELVTNGSNFIRAYDPFTGTERWRLGGSSKITAPTPVFGDGLIVVASGRRPERPIFVVRAGAKGDLTLSDGATDSEDVSWHRRGRGPYMPTPLIYDGLLYILSNNGILDAYDLVTGREIYRERIQHSGSGFSASPVAAAGRIYLSNEDGDMVVVRAGPQFEQLSTNPMGEPLMATPAIVGRFLYVRGSRHLFGIASTAGSTGFEPLP